MSRVHEPGLWRIWVDTGGTFTDCIAADPAGLTRRVKVLSSSALRGRVVRLESERRILVEEAWGAPPGFIVGLRLRRLGEPGEVIVESYQPRHGGAVVQFAAPLPGLSAGAPFEVVSDEQPPILAARLATGTPAGRPLPPMSMRIATTRGTNALLERRGAETALFITRGFGDLLVIGTQQRPELFSLRIEKPPPLHHHVVEVDERLDARGGVVRPLDLDSVAARAAELRAAGVQSAAVALLHSWVNPAHELAVAATLREAGFEHISCSSQLAPTINLLSRTQTAVINAYLSPVLGEYLAGVERALGLEGAGGVGGVGGARGSLHVMTSAGGLVGVGAFAPKDSLLSGPAGGVVGAAAAARASNLDKIIAFDMGGTSTDVARSAGEQEYVFEHQVGPARVVAPAVAVESVAAGGGSVCWFDVSEGVLKVGPQSAGANPGPACYGAGGPLTVTDVNLLLGRLDAGGFEIPVDRPAAEARARELAATVAAATGEAIELGTMLEGLIDIADERMAEAIRAVSIRRGYDPAEHALVAFGGAGGQHACGVAERLGMTTVMVPRDVGLLSAAGLGIAALERFAERQVLRGLDGLGDELGGLLRELGEEARAAVIAEGAAAGDVAVQRRLIGVRLAGQESSLTVEVGTHDAERAGADLATAVRAAFVERYRAVYGYESPAGRRIEVESVRVVASTGPGAADLHAAKAPEHERDGGAEAAVSARFGGSWCRTRIVGRDRLNAGHRVRGPAIIVESFATTVVRPGWELTVDGAGALVLRRMDEEAGTPLAGAEQPAAVRDAVLTGRLAAIATEMGETLRRTAISTNVKERLDYSCAILDSDGELIVNAPHIPVHLGALGPCVRALMGAIPMGPGDVVVTNHPAFGGSHLPDVTVVTPVFDPGGRRLGFVASRAHHAEIGGSAPGSMPPAARALEEEGVVIPPLHLVRGGVERFDDLRRLLAGGRWPSRAVEENLADLAAQAAANRRGESSLVAVAAEVGADELARAMAALKDRAEARIREAFAAMDGRVLEAEETLDDGSPIRVAVRIGGGGAVVDFAGSAGVHPGNFNAPPGVVRSALIYVLRLLIDEPLPLNEGLMRAVELRIPAGMLSPPFRADPGACPAVAAGNVETSQRVVDTLLKALGLAACSQGTMNNVIFGNDRFGYYETVCGGAGAVPGSRGADAVHTHMTNTRITDPEVLELRYPVRLERFAVRCGSGGAGRWPGGDGVIREYVFLEPVRLSVRSQHRASGPYGAGGGEPGRPGRQRIVRAEGSIAELGAAGAAEVGAGDRLVLETPGGGGFGRPADAAPEGSRTLDAPARG